MKFDKLYKSYSKYDIQSCKLLWLWLVHGNDNWRSVGHSVTTQTFATIQWRFKRSNIRYFFKPDFVNKRAKIWNRSQNQRKNSCYANRVWKRTHDISQSEFIILSINERMKSMIAEFTANYPYKLSSIIIKSMLPINWEDWNWFSANVKLIVAAVYTLLIRAQVVLPKLIWFQGFELFWVFFACLQQLCYASHRYQMSHPPSWTHQP